jgi:hypothetical protein
MYELINPENVNSNICRNVRKPIPESLKPAHFQFSSFLFYAYFHEGRYSYKKLIFQ